MQVYRGKSVCDGITIGKISVYKKYEHQVKRVQIKKVETEIERFRQAKAAANEELQKMYEKVSVEIDEVNAAIFKVHQMLLEDAEFIDCVENHINTQRINAEYAVELAKNHFGKIFAAMDDDYMRARAADINDVAERLQAILSRENTENISAEKNMMRELPLEEPVIIVAEDLSPSETMKLDKNRILAFVTVRGSLNSHTAILARSMGILALIGTEIPLNEMIDGKLGIVDGIHGKIYVEPDEETLLKMQEKEREETEKKELLYALRGKENITLDGRRVKLCANIGSVDEIETAIWNDADGIGLFRSEFIYLEKHSFPTEEEQFRIYKQVLETMADKQVIIRTLDIGADKKCDYFYMDKEENPALGCRAIRLSLKHPEIFKTQLRALFRASVYGKLAIMYPMIISIKELQKIREIVSHVQKELTEEGIPFGSPKQGIMIETPAAAIMSDELAREVDFFSIGTNDLTQYMLAIDRQNPKLDEFYDPHHPAVLRMIGAVIENAHKEGKWVGICGELGADTSLTKEFLAMGVDAISVSPGNILAVKKTILETNIKENIFSHK